MPEIAAIDPWARESRLIAGAAGGKASAAHVPGGFRILAIATKDGGELVMNFADVRIIGACSPRAGVLDSQAIGSGRIHRAGPGN